MKQQPMSGGYVLLQAPKGSEIAFLERKFATDAQGMSALGIGREVAGLHEIEIILPDGSSEIKTLWIDTRDYETQRIEGVDMSRVTPPDSVTERIISEANLVRSARNIYSSLPHWKEEQFIAPVSGRVTGVYGSQRYYNGIPRSPHWGIDYAAAKGTAVLAPAGGRVVLAEPDLYFSGGTVVLDHGGGVTSSFLHLSAIDVRVGQLVEQGEVIARVGSTGRSTGPHLDWRMNLHGERIDAALWLKPAEAE